MIRRVQSWAYTWSKSYLYAFSDIVISGSDKKGAIYVQEISNLYSGKLPTFPAKKDVLPVSTSAGVQYLSWAGWQFV